MANVFIQLWLACLKIIFTFLHLIFSGFQYFDSIWSLFKRKLELLSSTPTVNEELYIARWVAELEKRPQHLALILGSEVIQFDVLTNIIIWSVAAGISFLSLYDQSGVIKENETKLYNYVMSRVKTSTQIKFRNVPVKNGISGGDYKNKILVSVLSETDGKVAFTSMVKRLCSEVRKPSDLTIDVINEELKSESKFPDPDLAILVGPTTSTYGYPPWQIPVTEFEHLNSLENLDIIQFSSVLSKYSSCQQRFGK